MSTILVIVAVVLSVVGYIFYRYSNAPTAEEVSSITRIEGFSPSKCTARTNSFDGAVSSRLYVAHGKMRIDKKIVAGASIIDFHDILTSENNGTSHAWFERLGNEGIITVNIFGTGEETFGGESFECVPWWFVDDSVFEIPNSIIFPSDE